MRVKVPKLRLDKPPFLITCPGAPSRDGVIERVDYINSNRELEIIKNNLNNQKIKNSK